MKKGRTAILAALCVLLVPTATFAAGQRLDHAWNTVVDRQVVLLYDPSRGELSITVGPNERSEGLSTFQLESAAGRFLYTNATFYPPHFPDVTTEQKLFHLNTAGFAAPFRWWFLGVVLPTGLGVNTLLEDLLVDGSYKTGGNLMKYGRPPALFWVPEPSSLALLSLGLIGLLRLRRVRSADTSAAGRSS